MSSRYCWYPPCYDDDDDDDDGWTTAQIVGTVVGFSVAALIVIGIVVWRIVLCNRQNRVNANGAAHPNNNANPNTNTYSNPNNNNNNYNNYNGNYGGGTDANQAYYYNSGGAAAPTGGQDPYLAAPPPNTYGLPVYGSPTVADGGYGTGQYYAPTTTNGPATASPYPGVTPPPLYGGLPMPKYDQNTNYTTPEDPAGVNYNGIAPLGTNPLAARSVPESDAAKKAAQKEKDISYVSAKKSDD